ncbi:MULTISPECIES: hypothetical protein [unclassified Mesorhizobium]|uniref:hypothetical protein n=1 Tax=unclassified Mesorhizobium TaxID=325217 RepID=UPI003336CB98
MSDIDHAVVAAAAKKRFDTAYDRTKKLSDFVGMLTRLAFLVLLGTFVASDLGTGFSFSVVTRWCALLAISGISIKLTLMVGAVIGAKLTEYTNSQFARVPGGVKRWHPARLAIELFCLLAVLGLSGSLISYGARLAERMSDHTHIQSQ